MKKQNTELLIVIFFLITQIIFSQEKSNVTNCTNAECHNNFLTKQYVHSPIKEGCLTCHEKVKGDHPNQIGNEFVLVEENENLCKMCHNIEIIKKTVHTPFNEGKCLSCHSPHSSEQKGILIGNTQQETCSKCHKLENKDHKFVHGPFVSHQCSSCHISHQSDFKNLLVKEDPGLCFQCHQEKEEFLKSTNVHPVYEEGCLDCHLPHSSSSNYLLVSGKNDLCFGCHKNVEVEISTAKIIHDPLKQDGQCISCHTPHAGEISKLLLEEQPALCFRCHSENTKNKEKYIDILGTMSKKYLHKPLINGKCDDCHLHHVSPNTSLLSAKFPKGNYTVPKKESFELCFNCHDSKMLNSQTITNETNFRNGTQNLHYVHVMKKKSISCQSCHDMHGADNQHILGNFVYFGNWQMPINYKVSEIGGSCLPGCHAQFSYSRK
ncbi:MAG: hypothetical protein IPH62_06495 [Ignavibacteriae bacterium]|nr:hypothetical protein [Ignavibacteriota bacterium]